MVAFLGYALRVTLKHLLKGRPAIMAQPSLSEVDPSQPLSPMRVLALLSTLQSADIVLPTTDGREIRLRRITEPVRKRNRSCTNYACAFLTVFNTSAIVVQTRRLPELILNGLAEFWPPS
jgi:hypothetical protein